MTRYKNCRRVPTASRPRTRPTTAAGRKPGAAQPAGLLPKPASVYFLQRTWQPMATKQFVGFASAPRSDLHDHEGRRLHPASSAGGMASASASLDMVRVPSSISTVSVPEVRMPTSLTWQLSVWTTVLTVSDHAARWTLSRARVVRPTCATSTTCSGNACPSGFVEGFHFKHYGSFTRPFHSPDQGGTSTVRPGRRGSSGMVGRPPVGFNATGPCRDFQTAAPGSRPHQCWPQRYQRAPGRGRCQSPGSPRCAPWISEPAVQLAASATTARRSPVR